MKFKRSAGILLHPTSLPGPDGIGDLGPEAFRWVNFLEECGCGLWQILPLNPTGYGDSPYQSFSAFAGNPYLISAALLLEDGLLTRKDLRDRPEFPVERVDYGPVIEWKLTLLDRAYRNFREKAGKLLQAEYAQFQTEEAFWLNDFALFMAIKEAQGGVSWDHWTAPLRERQPAALQAFEQEHAEDIDRHKLRQFLFFRQWRSLRSYANQKGIQIIGDIPIFVAFDSADAWGHPELFYMNRKGQPTVVAGVPPDYFSETGQLWGNPLYRWPFHKETGYHWWLQRLRAILKTVDIVRLDHFRGFGGYWEVQYGAKTAEEGRWVKGPGGDFFDAVGAALGELPIIAEDLGEITTDVIELREQYRLPGMRILQFAFAGDSSDPFLPHNYIVNCAAYTGTHDNDTARGWYENAPEKERDFVRRYLGRSGEDIAWDMIRAVWSSVAVLALAPMQDFLSEPTEARMNFPGRASGNWGWRMMTDALSPFLVSRIQNFNRLYRRLQGEEKLEEPKVAEYEDADAPVKRKRPKRVTNPSQ
jgi:4-alpha-glucanotransferase